MLRDHNNRRIGLGLGHPGDFVITTLNENHSLFVSAFDADFNLTKLSYHDIASSMTIQPKHFHPFGERVIYPHFLIPELSRRNTSRGALIQQLQLSLRVFSNLPLRASGTKPMNILALLFPDDLGEHTNSMAS